MKAVAETLGVARSRLACGGTTSVCREMKAHGLLLERQSGKGEEAAAMMGMSPFLNIHACAPMASKSAAITARASASPLCDREVIGPHGNDRRHYRQDGSRLPWSS